MRAIVANSPLRTMGANRATRGTILVLTALLAAQSASAGTKFVTSLITADGGPPSLSGNSQLFFKNNAKAKVILKEVTATNGSLVTTQKPAIPGQLNGDEYIVVIHGRLISIDMPFDLNAVVELKKGNGKVKLDLTSLFDLLPAPLLQAIGIEGVAVYGPLGVSGVAVCQSVLNDSDGISYPPALNPCVGGNLIGRSGIIAPQPSAP